MTLMSSRAKSKKDSERLLESAMDITSGAVAQAVGDNSFSVKRDLRTHAER